MDVTQRAWRTRAWALVAVLTAVRLVIVATTPLADGEAYYALWARFPAWSYYDHPPLLAWLSWLATRVSDSALSLRFFPVLCATALAMLIYRLGEKLYSPRAGFIAMALVSAMPVFFVNAMVLNPEGPLGPLWALGLLLLASMRDRDEAWRPLAFGAVVGFAFLAKYTGVLLIFAGAGYLLASPEARRWWKRPATYAGALVALAVASPVIVWNQLHGWPSLTLHFVERAAPWDVLGLMKNAAFVLVQQWGSIHPLLFPALLLSLWHVMKQAKTDDRARFLAWVSAPVLLFFFVAMVRVVDPEPQWTMVGWLPLTVVAGAWLDQRLAQPLANPLRWYVRASFGLSAAILLIAYVHSQSPVLLKVVPDAVYEPKHDVINEMIGWSELKVAISKQTAAMGDGAVVASCQYALCAQLLRQLDDQPNVFCPSSRRTEFDFIERRDPPASSPVLYLDNDHYNDEPTVLLPQRNCTQVQTVEIERGGRVQRHYRLFSCSPVEALRADARVVR